MQRQSTSFSWEVFRGFYKWVDSCEIKPNGEEAEPKRYLTDGLPYSARSRTGRVSRYNPFEYPTLFRTFADTPATEEGIVAFAKEYGTLGGGAQVQIAIPFEGGSSLVGFGETLETWRQEIENIGEVIKLWDLARSKDIDGLKEHIVWPDPQRVLYRSLPDSSGISKTSEVIASDSSDPDELSLFLPGELIQPALHYVSIRINKALESAVAPKLLWNEDYTQLHLQTVPDSLLAAIWLQLAQAVAANKDYRQCKQCGRWFEISADAFRESRLFCSDACRSKDYRDRKKGEETKGGKQKPST